LQEVDVAHPKLGKSLLTTVLICSELVACQVVSPEPSTPFVSPVLTTIFESPQTELPQVGRALPAIGSFEAAMQAARLWNTQSAWYGIMPSKLMQGNLGIPTTGLGWFFRFGLEENTLEYYVHVEKGKVTGTTEAQPILTQPLPYKLLAIEISEITIDSTQVLEIYMQNGGEQYFAQHPGTKLDFRLLHVEGSPHPVWSLLDTVNPNEPLINIDAATGEIVANPFT
jgi:hypothetical protein